MVSNKFAISSIGIILALLYYGISYSVLSLLLLLIVLSKLKTFYLIYKTWRRDFGFLRVAIPTYISCMIHRRRNTSVVTIFKEFATAKPHKIFMLFEGKITTYKKVDELSNKIGNIFLAAGYQKNDVVALYMFNKTEYMCIWLGLAKIGVIASLINYNHVSDSLVHSINISKAKAIIFGAEQKKAVQDVISILDPSTKYYILDGSPENDSKIQNLNILLDSASVEPTPVERIPKFNDKLFYIFTSGTSGLPKAAIVPHSKFIFVGKALKYQLNFKFDDIFYTPLPLYHMAAGVIASSCPFISGVPLVFRSKFSASAFWSDCVNNRVTAAQYIGELCRYLMNNPVRPEEKTHRLRVMLGNGLRPIIWEKFVERFNIPWIIEFYGSTEGNIYLANPSNVVGAIGFIPNLIPPNLQFVELIRVDEETCEPIRTHDGLCIRCQADEPGMIVGLITTKIETQVFHGYADKKETSKKIISNVFSHGDKAFVSGDIVVKDELGYIYFKDRTGDTFRWKGENVSTTEVEGIISKILGLKEVTVYGVQVSHTEGRAGMLAIEDPEEQVDLPSLAENIDSQLPGYARPLFVRVLKKLATTGTMKIIKTDLRKEGYDPSNISDKLFFRSGKNFIPLTQEVYNDIENGKIRL